MKVISSLAPFLFFLVSTSQAFSACDFKTGKYTEELLNPVYIQNIQINVPKSAKYAKNLSKVFSSKSRNIPPELKKKFKANVVINYQFGKCEFKGSIKQNGDEKDHIGLLSGGRPYRSLNVKLDTGNVVSAVQFKLLIPKTRNGKSEILASLILKNLGLISPETFAVEVGVNGVSSTMLFQESARKELLERNYRREGPIFEGDEALLWSFEDFNFFELENISLSRMTNKKWFMKGDSSQAITLSAYSALQSAYLDYATNMKNAQKLILTPNKKVSPEFSEFMFALLAMNGSHALRPHNRKFYFNAITSKFEPIYYDGNVSFIKVANKHRGRPLDTILFTGFSDNVSPNFIDKIADILNSEVLRAEFSNRAKALNKSKTLKVNFEKFFNDAIAQYYENVQYLDNKITNMLDDLNENKMNRKPKLKFLEAVKNSGVSQNHIQKLEALDGEYIATFHSGNQQTISIKDVSKVISRNNLNGERTVFIGNTSYSELQKNVISHPVSFAKKLTMSAGVKVSVSETEKILTFIQEKENDWVLIQSGEFNGWKIEFNGIQKTNNSKLLTNQRFNQNGITGCINFYKSNFQNTTINVSGGVCEDSINIINSSGTLKSIFVDSAFADAIDIDFSIIDISEIYVTDAGNDCFDVSGGSYQVSNIYLNNCLDKGVSVGEGSTLFATNMELNSANIGVSSKDLSKVEILNAQLNDINVCLEALQKKQEFGGGSMTVENLECDGIVEVDINSVYEAVLH
ncbi:hypothetical protein N8370_05925 [Amylibacter sp.]|nr:hypothetical protein [Amylibacter sp.]